MPELHSLPRGVQIELGWVDGISRAKKRESVPVVLSREEVAAILARLSGREHLMVALMYGTGLRVRACVSLRVQSIDFGYRQITVYNGKGAKDRFVPLPDALVPALKASIEESARLLAADKADVHLILVPADETGLSRAVGETQRRYSG